MEQKLKQIVLDWRKAESQDDKKDLMKQMQAMLFKQKEKQVREKAKKKLNSKYLETGEEVKTGVMAVMRQNNQVGTVREIRGKKAILQLGAIPITVDISDLTVVREKEVS